MLVLMAINQCRSTHATPNTRPSSSTHTASTRRWVEYAKAKDDMFRHTDTKASPWFVVPSDDKKAAHVSRGPWLKRADPRASQKPPRDYIFD
jgi:hypothetical protein